MEISLADDKPVPTDSGCDAGDESFKETISSLGHKSKIIKSSRLKVMKSKINLSPSSDKEKSQVENKLSSAPIKDKFIEQTDIAKNNDDAINNQSLTDRYSCKNYIDDKMDIDSPKSNPSNRITSYKKPKNNNAFKFIYGNYSRYYGYRNKAMMEDARMSLFDEHFFEDKDVLDIGCNIGHVTLTIASRFKARKVVGTDIDRQLINIAKKNIVHYAVESQDGSDPLEFAKKVYFNTGNYVPDSDDVSYFSADYDIILALSVTKWFHLHNADVGLKRAFRKMFKQLRPGGRLILEFQEWSSYKKRRKLTETVSKNYYSIKFFPDQFIDFLLSREVGFSEYLDLGVPSNNSKGFQRPIYCFYK